MKFETQHLHDVLDLSRWPSPTNLSIKDPTPGWRTGSSWWGSWWPISMKIDMVHLHDIPDGSQACPKHFQTHMSLKNPTPGSRTGSILTGFLMTNLHEIWNLVTLLCLELSKMSISNFLCLSLRSPPPPPCYLELDREWRHRAFIRRRIAPIWQYLTFTEISRFDNFVSEIFQKKYFLQVSWFISRLCYPLLSSFGI